MTITANKYLGKDLYFVAVKLFLEDKDGKLFIFKDRFGEWDLPGGRLRINEFKDRFSMSSIKLTTCEKGISINTLLII